MSTPESLYGPALPTYVRTLGGAPLHGDAVPAGFTAFVQHLFGVRYVGDTDQNKGQCVGLVEAWLDVWAKPHIWGDAKDLLANADPKHYVVTANGPSNYPPPGAIVVWDSTWGGGAGHTAVVVAATALLLGVFEQNNPEGAPPLLGTHPYDGVLGWLTFR